MTYEQAVEKIDSLLIFGVKPGLERITALLNLMGNPHNDLQFVHIAGTNGKGSVSNMTASVLKNAGYKTGLFTSPHITGFGERMQINFERISEQDLAVQVEKLFPYVEKLKSDGIIITEFEFVTAIALNWFKEQQCDVVVLETGLGGRFDATNVIPTPLCSVITSISLDHTGVLGDTLEQIAMEKCGIIKNGGATVFAFQEDEVNNVVALTAAQRENVLYTPTNLPVNYSDILGSEVVYGDMTLHLPLVGKHQIKNLALVLCAIDALKKRGIKIPNDAVVNGISEVKMPARFEVLSKNPLFVLDGAHNPGGLKALSEAIDTYLSGKSVICVMGMLKDKDCKHSLAFLSGKIDKFIATTVANNPRRQTAQELAQTATEFFDDIVAEENACKAVELAIEISEKTENSAILVCGSLYMASEVRFYLRDNHIFDF